MWSTRVCPDPGTLRRDKLIEALDLELTPYVEAMPDLMLDAVPTVEYDIDAYEVCAPRACESIADGDTIDLGDRTLTAPVTVVYPGHGDHFGRERLLTLIRDYIESRGGIIR